MKDGGCVAFVGNYRVCWRAGGLSKPNTAGSSPATESFQSKRPHNHKESFSPLVSLLHLNQERIRVIILVQNVDVIIQRFSLTSLHPRCLQTPTCFHTHTVFTELHNLSLNRPRSLFLQQCLLMASHIR